MKKLISLLLILTLAVLTAACELPSPAEAEAAVPPGSLRVHFIDVGQGDSTLLESDGEFVLVDAGEDLNADTLVTYLISHGVRRLKYAVVTHPHSDHYGGMAAVLDSIPAERFITVETDCSAGAWMRLLHLVDDSDIPFSDAFPGDTYSFGSASFTILAPLSDDYEGYNDYSAVMRVTCGDIRFMLTGDAEKESEYEMLDAGEDVEAEVLKCGHHGSSDATSTRFLREVDPIFAVISCGRYNDYGHPHRETLKRLQLMECDPFRTDLQGTILATTDGRELTFCAGDDETVIGAYTIGDSRHDLSALDYIGNKNSGWFHDPICDGAQKMSEKNKVFFSSREDALAVGYQPCPECCP